MRLLSFPRKNDEQSEVKTLRMILRRPVLEHHKQWAALREESADHLQPFEPKWSRSELTMASYQARLRQQEGDINSGRGHHWFLFEAETESLLGGLSLTNIRRGIVESGTLGYWMGQRYSNQRYMREAVNGVTDHAFSKIGLHRVEASTVLTNIPSQRLLAACGFSNEGQAKAYLKINGSWRDHFLFAKINPDHA